MINTQYINLNLVPSGVLPVLYCSQYDVGRPLGVSVYNGGEVVDLDDYVVTMEATRTDGTAITAAVNTNDNTGVFWTTATMTNVRDKYDAQIVLTNGSGARIASLPFVMCVIAASMDENAESIEEDRSLYQQYTSAVQAQISAVNEDLSAETDRAESAESALQSNIDAEAAARRSADNQLQISIGAEEAARIAADTNLQTQINNILAPSGTAPSSAEVENARIGVDSTVYSTLGDAIRGQISDAESQVVGLSDRTDIITGAVNYAYNDIVNIPENPSSGIIIERYGVKRELTQITLNASNPHSSYTIRVKVSGSVERAYNTTMAKAWDTGIQLKEGHTYQLETKYISGSITTPDGVNPPAVTVYKVGETTSIITAERDGFSTVATFVAPAEEVNLVFYIHPSVALVNATYQVILRDMVDVFDAETKEKLKGMVNWNPMLLNYGGATIIMASEEAPINLDDYLTPGNYYISNVNNARYVENIPVLNGGRLIVLTVNALVNILQIYIPTVQAGYRIYTRSKHGSAEFTPWLRVLTNNMVDQTPTMGSANLVTSGGVYDAIKSTAGGDTSALTPNVQPSSAGKIYFPSALHSEGAITYAYSADGTTRKVTQGICSDGKRYLYFPFKVAAGSAGDDEYPVMCKWDAATNSPVIFATAEKSYGHIEDMCFVPAYVPGFDDGNVDRLYLTDMNKSTEAGETGTVHVISADDLSFITSFTTYDAEDNTNNLISKTLAPFWHGIYHVGYSPEREQFMVHSADNEESGGSTVHRQTLAVFDVDGNLIKGLNFIRAKGTYCGFDCDENFIYTTIYLATETEDVFDIYFYIFDWNLNPIGKAKIDQMAWEIEGVCHIGTEFYISWIKKAGSARDGIYITKTSYVKNQTYDLDTTFPVGWTDTLFNRSDFTYFTAT